MKTLFQVTVAVVAAVVVLSGMTPVALIGTASAATITVDDDGGADYTSIQAAVDNANAGDTIQVAAGTYNERVVVDKPLTLVGDPGDASAGAGPDAPVLDGGGSTGTAFTVQAAADGTRIEGFVMQNYGSSSQNSNGIRTESETVDNLVIRNNTISTYWWGIGAFSGSTPAQSATVVDNEIVDTRYAIILGSGYDGATIRENVVRSTGPRLSTGLYVRPAASGTVLVESNDVDGTNGPTGEFAGLIVRGGSANGAELTIRDNKFAGYSNGISYSGWFSGTLGTTKVIGNRLVDNTDGVSLSGGANTFPDMVYSGNEIANNDNGISITSGTGVGGITVTQNNIRGNQKGIVNSNDDEILDARNNYWGASDGPSSATSNVLADPVDTGVLANGSGDTVSGPLSSDSDLSNVQFAPFATDAFDIGVEPQPTPSPSDGGGSDLKFGEATFSPSDPVVGEEVTISVPVENTGTYAGTVDGMFRSDFIPQESVDVRIGPGETEVISQTVIYNDAESYNVYLADTFVGEVTIQERDPTSTTVAGDPDNGTVSVTVERPRRTAISVDTPPMNASNATGVTLTGLSVTPDTIDNFELGVTQSDVQNASDTPNDTDASNATGVLPDGTAAVTTFDVTSSLAGDDVADGSMTFEINLTRYPSLANASDVTDALGIYRYDAATDTYTRLPITVDARTNDTLTVTVPISGPGTYVVGVDQAVFDVETAVDGNPVTAGNSVTLVLDVTNVGDGPGSYQPTVTFQGETIETDELTLNAGESGTLTVEIVTEAPGVRPIFIDGRLTAFAFVESSDEGN